MFHEFLVHVVRHAGSFVYVGERHARVDAVDAHALQRQLQRRAGGQLVDGRLGHAVDEDAGERARSGDAGHVDDAAARRDQMRNAQYREMEHRPHVNVHHAIVLLHRRRLDRFPVIDSRAVDQNVQSTKLLDRGVNQVGDVRLIGQLGDDQEMAFCVGRTNSYTLVPRHAASSPH